MWGVLYDGAGMSHIVCNYLRNAMLVLDKYQKKKKKYKVQKNSTACTTHIHIYVCTYVHAT